MILVIGGTASGKRTFAQSLGFTCEDGAVATRESSGALSCSSVVLEAQELVWGETVDPAALAEALAEKELVTCTEVGCGIVPLDGQERLWRERAGRLTLALADRADAVVRVVCGIPVVLKGALPEADSTASHCGQLDA